ncbi:MAG: hypothetical protein ACTHNN_16425 [Xanthobacteraceae bacterium]
MSRKFSVEIYCGHNGIRMELPWWNDDQFNAGVSFLRGMVGAPVHRERRGEPDCFYLETEDQFAAVMQLRRDQGVKRPD